MQTDCRFLAATAGANLGRQLYSVGEAGYSQQAGAVSAHQGKCFAHALGQEHVPPFTRPTGVNSRMEVFPISDVDRIAANPFLVLVDDFYAAVVGNPGPEEGKFLTEQSVELELPWLGPTAHVVKGLTVQIGFVVVDTLVHRFGPVGIPFAHVFVTMVAGVHDLRRQVFRQGHRFGFSHPDVHDAIVLIGGIGPSLHLAHDRCIRAVDQASNTLTLSVKGVSVVFASDSAREKRFTLGQPGATVRAPVE